MRSRKNGPRPRTSPATTPAQADKGTPPSRQGATLQRAKGSLETAGASGALENVFRAVAHKRSTPISRYLFLRAGVVAGTGAAGYVMISNTVKDKSLTQVAAGTYRPTAETTDALHKLANVFAPALTGTRELRELHEKLFTRTARVTWTVMVKCGEECDTDDDGNKVDCEPEYCEEDRHAKKKIFGDDLMRRLKRGYLKGKQEHYEAALPPLGLLSRTDLLKVEGRTDVRVSALDRAAFARHFDFDWREGQLAPAGQILLASGLGLFATGLILFYNEIAAYLTDDVHVSHSHDGHSDEVERVEPRETRRAVFSLAGGVAAFVFARKSQASYDERSAEIRANGEAQVRTAATEANRLGAVSHFQRAFNVPGEWERDPSGYFLNETRRYAAALSAVTHAEVDRATWDAIKQVREANRQLLRKHDDSTTTHLDDAYDGDAVQSYVKKANDLGAKLQAALGELERVFAQGVPDALLPAMRASYVTDAIREAVNAQASAQYLRLLGDYAFTYLPSLVLLLLTEPIRPLNEGVHKLVKTAFDIADKIRLGPVVLLERMQRKLPQADRETLRADSQVRRAVRDNLRDLRTTAAAYAEAQVVYAPTQHYLGGLNVGAKKALLMQLEQANEAAIVDFYLQKALAAFVAEQTSIKEIGRLVRGEIAQGSLLRVPKYDELQAKVVALIAGAKTYFLFDLLDASVIQDFDENETWESAEPAELTQLIARWGDRIVGAFQAAQGTYASLGILPPAWFSAADGGERLTRGDVVLAFRKAMAAELAGPGEIDKARREVLEKLNQRGEGDERAARPVDDSEIESRVLLRRLEEAYASSDWLEILRTHEPRLAKAFADASEASSST